MDLKTWLTSKTTLPLLVIGAIGLVILAILGLSGLARPKVEGRATLRPMNPMTAEISALTGWVEVQERDGTWAPAQKGQRIGAGQRIRTGDLSSAELLFNDDSQASLSAGSELLINLLNARKSGGPREIVLTQLAGESSHSVAPNSEEGSQYLVKTPDGSGEAKGTVFTVVVSPGGSYYYVSEGTVAVTSVDITVLVGAGHMTVIVIGQPPLAPVMTITSQGVLSQTGDTWVVAGQSYAVNASTVISGSPQVGDWVMVKGRVRADGTNQADWILLLRASPANRFSLSGLVQEISPANWTVQGQAIEIDEQTSIAAGIAVGDRVRVEGLVEEGGLLYATSIQPVEETPELRFAFSGVLQEMGSEAWMISGVSVGIDDDTEIEADLEIGMVVNAAGRILADGGWQAETIRAAQPDEQPGFQISGTLESLAPWQVAGRAFETREWTVIADGLEVGDQVRVTGQIDAQGVWIADTIERLDEDGLTRLVLIGTVISTDPWVISGMSLTVSSDTVIVGQIRPGMLVRVEIVLAEDGSWLVVRIEPLEDLGFFSGCMDITATVVSINGSQVQLLNWPVMVLAEGAQVEGEIKPNSLVHFRICFGEDGLIQIVYIIIIQVPGDEVTDPGDNGDGGKVAICHKPGKKKGGNTLYVSRSAVPAHLGHGDYLGACR